VAAHPDSSVPDVLAPGLRCVFCGINPGRVSAAAAAHFANPRNDFWRLLHDAGFTPRLFDPREQFSLLDLGLGVTNAAYRTTPGSGDLRRRDFDAGRLEQVARDLQPVAIAFVGKEAYRGAFNERPELGPQLRTLDATGLYVLPSTSPANAAVPYDERNEAKALGARWDAVKKAWYVGPEADPAKLAKWELRHQPEPTLDPRAEFAAVLRSIGGIVDGDHPVMNGEAQRISAHDDKRGDRAHAKHRIC